MKLNLKRCIAAVALMLLCCLPALAEDSGLRPYVEVKGGGAFTRIEAIRNTSSVANPAQPSKGSQEDLVGVLGGAVGVNAKSLGLPMRAELEYAWRSDLDYNARPTFVNAATPTSFKSHLNSQTLFLNLYYDIETGTAFTPYVGAGIGWAWNRTEATGTVIATGASRDYTKTTDDFAWNIGAGCAYRLTDNWKVEAGYRYVNLGKVVWGDSQSQLTSKDITGHEVLLGLRYQF